MADDMMPCSVAATVLAVGAMSCSTASEDGGMVAARLVLALVGEERGVCEPERAKGRYGERETDVWIEMEPVRCSAERRVR